MPEYPWFKCYPQDALSDPCLRRCSDSTKGIWFFAWFTMNLADTYKLEGTLTELARDCGTSDSAMKAALEELERTKTADVKMQNDCIILTCRRLRREYGIKDLRRKAALSRWSKRDARGLQDYDANRHARSAYAYVSSSQEGRGAGEGNQPTVIEPSGNGPTRIEEVAQLIEDIGFNLFSRAEHQRPTDPEERAALEVVKRPNWKAEKENIMVLGRICKPEDRRFEIPKTLFKLLDGWSEALDKARNYKPHDNRKPNTRNVGTYDSPTDYGAAAVRKLERQALEAKLRGE